MVLAALPAGAAGASDFFDLQATSVGAAGACEAAFLYLALHPDYGAGRLPPHLWDGDADPAIPSLNLVTSGTRLDEAPRRAMLSNSFAFGGSNIALILGQGSW